MFRNEYVPEGEQLNMENLDDALRMSTSTTGSVSIDSSRPAPDIHPYLEIGRCLQDLRRSVFDMYKEEVSKTTIYEEDEEAETETSQTYQEQQEQQEHDGGAAFAGNAYRSPTRSISPQARAVRGSGGSGPETPYRRDRGTGELHSGGGADRSGGSRPGVQSRRETPQGKRDQSSEYTEGDEQLLEEGEGPGDSSAVQVSHSIALIVGQHEEKFASLAKEVDFWRLKSDALASQIAASDRAVSSKIDYVLQEQESLSGQQQQVLRELSEALSKQQALAAQMGANSPSWGAQPSSTPTPEQVQQGAAVLRLSMDKLDALMLLASSNESLLRASVTPLKAQAPGSAQAPPSATGSGSSPPWYSTGSGSSPGQGQLVSVTEMQRLYDNLSQQLRRLFAEKNQLLEELGEQRGANSDLHTRLRDETDALQQAMHEAKAQYEAQLRAARLLSQEAREQVAQLKGAEKRFQENERDLQMRIGDLDAQLGSRVLEAASVRSSLGKAQSRVAQLQEELAASTAAQEQSDGEVQELRRKHRDLARTVHSKDELYSALQRELSEMQGKLKRPFTTSVKQIESSDQRINYDYEISMLRESLQAVRDSEGQLQKDFLVMQTQSRAETKRLKEHHAADLAKAQEEHEAEAEHMRQELGQRRRHLEQQTRLRQIAEDDLGELRGKQGAMEQSVSLFKLENSELAIAHEDTAQRADEMKQRVAAKQGQLAKVEAEQQRAKRRIEKLEQAHDEKDKLLAELRHRQSRLQQSIRSHAEKEIDNLQALRHAMQSAAHRLNASEQATQSLRLKNSSPQSGSLPPSPAMDGAAGPGTPLLSPRRFNAGTTPGPGSAATSTPSPSPGPSPSSRPLSVQGRKLTLTALELECDSLWDDVPSSLEAVLEELRQFHLRGVNMSADLHVARANASSISTDLTAHISKQQQEVTGLRCEMEKRDVQARQQLDRLRASSEAEFGRHIDRLREELLAMSRQIDDLGAQKDAQARQSAAEREELQGQVQETQGQLEAAHRQLQEEKRAGAALEDTRVLSDRKCRLLAAELMHGVAALQTLASPSDRASASIAALEGDGVSPPEGMLSAVLGAVQQRAREQEQYLKTRQRSGERQQDALRTFLEALNSRFHGVGQSHRALQVQEQMTLDAVAGSPKAFTLQRQDLSHLYPFLCADDAQLGDMVRQLEENVHASLDRSHSVESFLIAKQQEMRSKVEQLQETRKELAVALRQGEGLQRRVTGLDSALHERDCQVDRVSEEMGDREAAALRERELLEVELGEAEEKLQTLAQRGDHLEASAATLEEDLAGCQTELRDARGLLDTTYAELQAAHGQLADAAVESEALREDGGALQQQLEHSREDLGRSQTAVVELQTMHAEYAQQVEQLKESLAVLWAQAQQAEVDKGALTTRVSEFDKVNALLGRDLDDARARLADAAGMLEDKLMVVVDGETRIAQLCGEVESQSFSLTQEGLQLKQAREQLDYSSTALAQLQIQHNALQRDCDSAAEGLAQAQDKNGVLESLVDEADGLIRELKSRVAKTQEALQGAEASVALGATANADLQQELADFQTFDVDYRVALETLELRNRDLVLLRQTLAQQATEYEAQLSVAEEGHETDLRGATDGHQLQMRGAVDQHEAQLRDVVVEHASQMRVAAEELRDVVVEHASQMRVAAEEQVRCEELIAQLSESLADVTQQHQSATRIGEELVVAGAEKAAEGQLLAERLATAHRQVLHFERQAALLAERTAALEEARGKVGQLQEQGSEMRARGEVLDAELQATQQERARLEECCVVLQASLQETRDTAGEQERALVEGAEGLAAKTEALAVLERDRDVQERERGSWERERESLQDKLQVCTSSLTSAQIDLADKSANLKVHLEWKLQMQGERAAMHEQLERAQEGQQALSHTLERTRREEEELTKECSFLQTSLAKAEAQGASQRSTIRSLRDANDELEAGAAVLQGCVSELEQEAQRGEQLERALTEALRDVQGLQLQGEAMGAELQDKNVQLLKERTGVEDGRKELEAAGRELWAKTATEAELRESRGELEKTKRALEVAERELHSRQVQGERLQLDLDAKAAQFDSALLEVAQGQRELRTTTEALYAARSSGEISAAQLGSLREEVALAKQQLNESSAQVMLRSATAEQQGRTRSELEGRVAVLEGSGRELQQRLQAAEAAKKELSDKNAEGAKGERERAEGRVEQSVQRALQLQCDLDVARRDLAALQRTADEAQLRFTLQSGAAEGVKAQLSALQADNNRLRSDVGETSRDRRAFDVEVQEQAGLRAENEVLRQSVAELQRRVQVRDSERQIAENEQLAEKNMQIASLRREADDLTAALGEHSRVKSAFDRQEEERAVVLKDLMELKIENEKLQSRIKTTQMDMELSQRQFSFTNLMMAGSSGVRAGNPFDTGVRERDEKLSGAMEKITALLSEKEASAVQKDSTQAEMQGLHLQLSEVRHACARFSDQNGKFEDKLDQAREKLEAAAVARSDLDHRNHSLLTEAAQLRSQLELRTHEGEKLAAKLEMQEGRASDAAASLQEKWAAAQGEVQKQTFAAQSMQRELEQTKGARVAEGERAQLELSSLQRELQASKSQAVQLHETAVSARLDYVTDRERLVELERTSAQLERQGVELKQRLGESESTAALLRGEVQAERGAAASLTAELASTSRQSWAFEQALNTERRQTEQLSDQIAQSLELICAGEGEGEEDSAGDASNLGPGSPVPRSPSRSLSRSPSRSLSPSRSRSSPDGRGRDGKLTVEHLALNLTSEMTKYHGIYAGVEESRGRNSQLEKRLSALTRQEGESQRAQHQLASQLEEACSLGEEQRAQLERAHLSLRENEHKLTCIKAANGELEFLCESMGRELKTAVARVEELDRNTAEQRAQWLRQMEQVRADAEERFERELQHMSQQVGESAEKLQAASRSTQSMQADQLQAQQETAKAQHEAVKAQQELESVGAAVRALYSQVSSVPPPSASAGVSFSAPLFADEFRATSPIALLTSLQGQFGTWVVAVSDLRASSLAQQGDLGMRGEIVDELDRRQQSFSAQVQRCLGAVLADAEALVTTHSAAAALLFAPSDDDPSAESLTDPYQRIVRAIAAARRQHDQRVRGLSAECETLRVKLSHRDSQLGGVHSYRDPDTASVGSNSVASSQQMQQRSLQTQLTRALRERTELLASVEKLTKEGRRAEGDLRKLLKQSAAAKDSWTLAEERYQTQVRQLQAQTQVGEAGTGARMGPGGGSNDALLQELLQYRAATEQKILDFDKLLATTFYHATGTPGQPNARSPEQLRLEQSLDLDEQEELGLGQRRGLAQEMHMEPTSPTPAALRRNSTPATASSYSTGTPGALATPRLGGTITGRGGSGVGSASDGLLSGMLQDFHTVLKEHRRLKRLCSSQQMCVMALRLLQKEREAEALAAVAAAASSLSQAGRLRK